MEIAVVGIMLITSQEVPAPCVSLMAAAVGILIAQLRKEASLCAGHTASLRQSNVCDRLTSLYYYYYYYYYYFNFITVREDANAHTTYKAAVYDRSLQLSDVGHG